MPSVNKPTRLGPSAAINDLAAAAAACSFVVAAQGRI